MKKLFYALFIPICIITLLCPITGYAAEHDIPLKTDISSIVAGDYIKLGHYMGEPILWRCVLIDENGPLMLSDKVICLKSYDVGHSSYSSTYRKNYGSNFWNTSCIRQWLNSTHSKIDWLFGSPDYSEEPGFMTNFTDQELNYVKSVTQKTYLNSLDSSQKDGGTKKYAIGEGTFSNEFNNLTSKIGESYYIYSMDHFFLLGPEQAASVFQTFGSDYLMAHPTEQLASSSTVSADSYCKYWMRLPMNTGMSYENVSAVNNNGYMNYGNARDNLGIRPAFYLNQDSQIPFVIAIEPKTNGMYIPSVPVSITWNNPIERGDGCIIVKEYDTDTIINQIDVSNLSNDCFYDDSLMIPQLFDNGDFGPVGKRIYLEFEDGCIIDQVSGESVGKISTKNMWSLRTIPVQTWGFRNLTNHINWDIFLKVFPPFLRDIYWLVDVLDGGEGQCYGMASAAGSVTMGFPAYNSFDANRIWSLSGIRSPDVRSNAIKYETARDFIGMAYVLQLLPQWQIQQKTNRENLNGLCDAVSAFQDGSGVPVIIDISGSAGNHTILAVGIEKTDSGYEILAHDSNRPTCLDCITVNGNNDNLTEWSISCIGDSGYSAQISTQLSDSISYETPGIAPYLWINSTTPLIELNYNLLITALDNFTASGISDEPISVSDGKIINNDCDYMLPIRYSNGGVQGKTPYWVLSDTPITLQGVGDDNNIETSIAGTNSKITVTASADAELTLMPKSIYDGGNLTTISSSEEIVTVVNEYVNENAVGDDQGIKTGISGMVNDTALIQEGIYGTEVRGFSNITVSVDNESAVKQFNLSAIDNTDLLFVSLNNDNGYTTVEISTDTTGDSAQRKTCRPCLIRLTGWWR